MSDTKLQELIETLKTQGVEAGEATSRRILEDTRKQADELLARARADADAIVARAETEAGRRMEQLKSSMQVAASQFVTNLKKVIEESLLTLPLKRALEARLNDTDFLKTLLVTLVQEYLRQSGPRDLAVLLPEPQREKLEDFALQLVAGSTPADGGDRLTLALRSENVGFGLRVAKADGDVKLDFTAEAFQALFLRYLSPRFREFFKAVKVDGSVGG